MQTLQTNSLLQGGKYQIKRFISAGGFGCTYEGVHTMLDTQVAIKEFFVKDFCNRDEQTSHVTVGTQSKVELVQKLRNKFVDEAKALYKMQHPNIVRVLDVFEENGTAYYVMDYIDGLSLHEIVKKRGSLPEQEVLGYVEQIANALKYVHGHNRLHLDIKPGNIMIDNEGVVKLIDFGASKQYDEVDGENTSTLLGKTPGYAPIEQMGNTVRTFTPATDIYALGATIYKCLTGVTPPDATLMASGEELEPLPTSICESTCNTVYTAMQINKLKRPQSIEEFLALLKPAKLETKTTVIKDEEATIVLRSPRHKIVEFGNFSKVNIAGIDYYFCKVESGSFILGEGCSSTSQMAHEVEITKPFYLGRTPVIQSLWLSVMGYNNSSNKGISRPVDSVSWTECQEFIGKLCNMTGLTFRLPTEAEWEYAAKGGRKTKGYAFSGSDNIDEVAWYDSNSMMTSHFVKQKDCNELGLYDMCGNVWEWCQDWDGSGSINREIDPQGPPEGKLKIIKGGCYYSSSQMCYPESRSQENPEAAKQNIGFRIVLEY